MICGCALVLLFLVARVFRVDKTQTDKVSLTNSEVGQSAVNL